MEKDKSDEEILNVFYEECKHDDGLTKEEAGDALNRLVNVATTLDIAHFWRCNNIETERINGEQFKQLYKDCGNVKKQIEAAFKYFDRNNDNQISSEELKELLSDLNIHGDESCGDDDFVAQTIKLADKNNDGMINIGELTDLLLGEHGQLDDQPKIIDIKIKPE